MPTSHLPPHDDAITQLLESAQAGQAHAWDRIYALLYQDLHRIARSQARRQRDLAMSPTSLISETWLRLVNAEVAAATRSHLLALLARAMRFVLVDEARRMLTDKRGQGLVLVPLDAQHDAAETAHAPDYMLALNQALEALAALDPRLVKVVELRYFGGLNEAEIADLLQINERTVRRDWRKARAYLSHHLNVQATTEVSRHA
ncbi:ECF-type sigma factor [Xanthomonas sp. SHU 199]|uniref:ECF-type sigma factor n=1 Tax=Xanthomonas sp. SHU 199 TaxID=1591174 RepID=UPI0009DAF0FE|nr:ECF-type sigma factor [Xanthomonas sp. SHU 199]